MRRTLITLVVISLFPGAFGQAGGAVQTASVTLTPAQLQHLHASPVQVVPSPGAGQFVNVLSVAYQYKAASTPYSVSGGGNFLVSPSAVYPVSAAGFIDQPTNVVAIVGQSTSQVLLTQSSLENAAITVQNDSAPEWSGGDGSVTVTVIYTIVALQ